MDQLLLGLAVLACPVGMGLMMWMMMRGGKKKAESGDQQQGGAAARVNHDQELAQLRSEVERLKTDRAGTAGEQRG